MFTHLAEILQKRSTSEKGITFIKAGKEETFVSYKALYTKALGVLHNLQAAGLQPGQELILQVDDNEQFVYIFWGCVLGGIIPVPITVGNNTEHNMKLFRIWDVLNEPHLLMEKQRLQYLQDFANEEQLEAKMQTMEASSVFLEEMLTTTERGRPHQPAPSDIAFIQFSSGSTGDPKGVVVTHENLVINVDAMRVRWETKPEDSIIGWMPLTHDMGLIACHIYPLLADIPQYSMQTWLFIRRPVLWFQKVVEHRVTILMATNFSFKFFLSAFKPELAKDWDLSFVKLIITGAEPISPDLEYTFWQTLAPYQLQQEAFCNVYGLAEATVAVSSPSPGKGIVPIHADRHSLNVGQKVVEVGDKEGPDVLKLVELGHAFNDCEMRICDEQNQVLEDDHVGFLQIAGKNVTSGYYNNPEATASVMTEDGWLHTGDLGFMRAGQLVLTGRAKEVIIIQGQNYYPHDIERVASSNLIGGVMGEVAACSVYSEDANEEELFVFVAYTKKREDFLPIAKHVIKQVSSTMGVKVAEVIPIRKIPKTTSGKIQRVKLTKDYQAGVFTEVIEELRALSEAPSVSDLSQKAMSETEKVLIAICQEILGIKQVGLHDNFTQFGINSVLLVQVHERINRVYPDTLQVSDLFAYPSIYQLASRIDNGGQLATAAKQEPLAATEEIAIIGMAVRMPKANTLDEYWANIQNGLDCVTALPDERKQDADAYFAYKNQDGEPIRYLNASYVEQVDTFDYEFFRITPKEANLMSPSQRLFMETAWSAIEDAGYGGSKLVGSQTGIYVGIIGDLEAYKYKEIIEEVDPESLPVAAVGNLTSMIPARISYLLNLKGPSVVIDTACSSSLIAVDTACRAIRDGSCEMAIAGGVRLSLLPIDKKYYRIGIESSDAATRTFDNLADGSGVGEGVGVVLLKPLHKALRDGDPIHAVIKGSASNQDGTSMGITAPNPAAQAEVLVKAWEDAGIHPESLQYIEVHGTATKLGDTIEIDGLRGAFRRYTDKQQFCAVSSVKSNMGHLYESAGIASLIKATLALKHKTLPPTIHFQEPNRTIRFEDSPIYINTKLRAWEKGEQPRRCAVSSFGISGTNCHLVLEEAPEQVSQQKRDERLHILPISAKKAESLHGLLAAYYTFLQKNEIVLQDVCYTAHTGRQHDAHRVALVVSDVHDLRAKLEQMMTSEWQTADGPTIFYGHHRPSTSQQEQADALVQEFVQGGKQEVALLEQICRLYVAGAEVNGELLYQGEQPRPVNIPTYVFAKKRCWVDIPKVGKGAEADHPFYTLRWEKESLATVANQTTSGTVLMFLDNRGIGAQLAERYRAAGRRVIEVQLGEQREKVSDEQYIITGEATDYTYLVEETGVTEQVIHLFALSHHRPTQTLAALEASQRTGVYSLFYLTKALAAQNPTHPVDIVLVASDVAEVTAQEETLHPTHAPLFGFGKVVRKEHPHLVCRAVDIDRATTIDQLSAELATPTDLYQVAYRAGSRYVEVFTSINPAAAAQREVTLKETGVYLITGGTGGIGREVARFLAAEQKVNLALVNRSALPPRAEWADILSASQDKSLCQKISALQQLEASGATVACYRVDVTNREQMQRLLDDLRTTYGTINGVIHGAGVGEAAEIITREEADFHAVFAPKVQGTWLLDELTQTDELDFFILFSSIATFFSASGQADYVAANAYLDAYAAYRSKQGKRTLTINWSTWKETGMAADNGYGIDTMLKAMTTEEALHRFNDVLHTDITRTLIGEVNYNWELIHLLDRSLFRLAPAISQKLSAALPKRQVIVSSQPTEVKLIGRDQADYSEVERTLAKICQDVLRFEELNIYDSFFELGADSILLKQMQAELEKVYPGKVVVADIFEYPSIMKLAQFIVNQDQQANTPSKPQAKADKKALDDELQGILDGMEDGNMSIDDVVASLRKL